MSPPARGAPPGGGTQRVTEFQQRVIAEFPLPHLHPVDASADRGLDVLRQARSRDRAVDDEAQDGGSARSQKAAIPSKGLDAEA